MAYFIGQRPTAGGELPRRTLFDGQNAYPRSAYRAFLNDALAAAADRTKHVVTHDHLFAVFELLVLFLRLAPRQIPKQFRAEMIQSCHAVYPGGQAWAGGTARTASVRG